MRTAESIEANQARNPEEKIGEKPKKKYPSDRSLQNLIAPWNPETAPRNGGRPKKDMAQVIAQKAFEDNPEMIYKACVAQLAKGGAFAFQVYSDRAFGKLKEKLEVSGMEEIAAALEAARKRKKG